MPEQISNPSPPRGLSRLAFRMPITFYRMGIGWLLGHRFLMLTHIGRVSGLPRKAVLEVVRYDSTERKYVVASGWGEKADWFRNVLKNPHVHVQSGGDSFEALATRLSPDEAELEMLDYGRRHPMALRELARIMGYRITADEAEYRALGRLVPMISILPVES